ncbi:MAG: hypothetical protein R3Y10_00125 [Ferrimonas sp.]
MTIKQTVIAAAVGTLLVGCSNSETVSPAATLDLQAFDGAVWGMAGSFDCGGRTGVIPATDYDGYSQLNDAIVLEDISACSFTFGPSDNAIDSSNGKDMSDVVYRVPAGMATNEADKVTASPFTTLISAYAELPENGGYSASLASEVLTELLPENFLSDSGLTVTALLTDLEGAIASASANYQSELLATTVVLSDALSANPAATPEQLSSATSAITATLLNAYPTYPDVNDQYVMIDVSSLSTTVINAPSSAITLPQLMDAVVPERPEDPTEPPPTGGGSASGGSGGTGG